MTVDPYVYPDTEVLRNALEIRDADAFARAEADITRIRVARLARQSIPGGYDLRHLQAFHRFIFEGIYDWAGETRSVNIGKPVTFCPFQNIATFAQTTFGQLAHDERLHSGDRNEFVAGLTHYLGEVNALHPFREGNGRAQRAFFAQLAADAGYHVAWSRADKSRNDYASMRSLNGDGAALWQLLDEIVELPI